MANKTDYRIQLLLAMLEEYPSIWIGINRNVTDVLYDHLSTYLMGYAGYNTDNIASDILNYDIPELENMSEEDIADLAGQTLEALSRRLVSKILWQAIAEEDPSVAEKMLADEDFQNTITDVMDF